MYLYGKGTVQRELWLEISVALAVMGSVSTWLMQPVAAFDSW